MTYNTDTIQIEERIFQGPSQPHSSSRDLDQTKAGRGVYRQGFHGHSPQSQPQPPKAWDAEWAMGPGGALHRTHRASAAAVPS